MAAERGRREGDRLGDDLKRRIRRARAGSRREQGGGPQGGPRLRRRIRPEDLADSRSLDHEGGERRGRGGRRGGCLGGQRGQRDRRQRREVDGVKLHGRRRGVASAEAGGFVATVNGGSEGCRGRGQQAKKDVGLHSEWERGVPGKQDAD